MYVNQATMCVFEIYVIRAYFSHYKDKHYINTQMLIILKYKPLQIFINFILEVQQASNQYVFKS